MDYLLTGANGFLGKLILNVLEKKYEIRCLSRTCGDYKVSLEKNIPELGQKFETVIHAAGKAHSIPRTAYEKNQFHAVNVIGTANLLRGLENVGAPKQFVFISSVSVYGQEKGDKINEEHPLKAKDPYGLSKIDAERLVLEWCSNNNVICTILRLPLLVGKKPPGNLGAMLKAIEKGYYFNIDGGKARKSMVLAHEVASFIPIVAAKGGVYNLTDGFHPNFTELSAIISKNKNKKLPLNLPLPLAKLIGLLGNMFGSRFPINSSKIKKIILDLTFDDSKARNLLGWNPEYVLEYLKRNSI